MSDVKKVIFDTDPGIDDTMAMILAHATDKIDLMGITTVFGNASIENATRNALLVKKMFGLAADVAKGSDTPLEVEAGEPTTFVHGENGLGNISLPDVELDTPDSRIAHDYIIEMVTEFPGEITLVAVGRLTNLALALQKAPEIAGLIKEVVIMGGAFGYNGHTGNVTPFAEANIIGDPHAADIVLTANWPVTVVGLDVTHQTIMDHQYMETLRECSEKYGQFIYDITRFYTAFHKEEAGIEGFYVHDSSAIMYVMHPELFDVRKGPIRVVTDGAAIGHTMLKKKDSWYPVDDWADKPQQTVCTAVNNKLFLETYLETLR